MSVEEFVCDISYLFKRLRCSNACQTSYSHLRSPRAVFTHCYGHSLNLACDDTIKGCKAIKDALDTTFEITKLIKKSPARNAAFKRLQSDAGSTCPGIRILCPTRWTVRADALQSMLANYQVLQDLWAESVQRVSDTEMKAKIQGVAAQMSKFEYYFGISLGLLILGHSDNLSRTLQRADMSAAEGQEVAQMTLKSCTRFALMRSSIAFSPMGGPRHPTLKSVSQASPVAGKCLEDLMMALAQLHFPSP